MENKQIGQINTKDIWTIPNIITYFRIICVPVYVALMALAGIRNDEMMLYVALGVFVVAASSDLVDGWIARRFNMQSGIGMVLDPFADKMMHISVLLCLSLCTGLTPLGAAHADAAANPWYVHYAFVILLMVREVLQMLIAPLVVKKGAVVKANWMGKVASATVSVGIILAFFHPYIGFADWGILAWGIALSYGAMFNYLFDVIKQVRKINRGEMSAATADSVKKEDMEIVAKKRGDDIGAEDK